MKTREEIQQEYALRVQVNHETWLEVHTRNREWRDAALAELDDPMLRLIAAAKKAKTAWESHKDELGYWHYPNLSPVNCRQCDAYVVLQSAINYAEQQRAQG